MGGGASHDKAKVPVEQHGAANAGPAPKLAASDGAGYPDNNVAEAAADEKKGEAPAKVPLQLKRLPQAKLREVSGALAVLKENGISELPDVEELLKVLRSSVAAAEGFATAYTDMCDWARTPNMWTKAVGAPLDPSKGFQLCSKSQEEVAKALKQLEEEQVGVREAVVIPGREGKEKKWQAKKAKHVESSGLRQKIKEREAEGKLGTWERDWEARFETFWEAQVAARAELVRLADESYKPRSLGVGPAVLFQPLPASAAWAPPAPKKRPLQSATDAEERAAASQAPVGSGGALCTATLHVGMAGCGIGAALWRRLMREHQVSAEGVLAQGSPGLTLPHFEETSAGHLVPRAVFVCDGQEGLAQARELGCCADDDLVTCDSFPAESTPYDFFLPVLHDKKAQLLFDLTTERLRRQIERMDGLRSLLLTHSAAEACGGGLTTRLLEEICNTYPRAVRSAACVVPAASECGEGDVRQLLGAAMCHKRLLDYTDFHVYVDRPAVQRLCTGRTPCGLGLTNPSIADECGIVAGALSAWTSPARIGSLVPASEGTLRLDCKKVSQNLVPYPRINTLLASFAPLRPESAKAGPGRPADLVQQSFKHGGLCSVDVSEGKLIAMGVFCRGLSHAAMVEAVQRHKCDRKYPCVDWSPTGFALGFHSDSTVPKEGECLCLSNSAAVGVLVGQWAAACEEKGQELNQVLQKYCRQAADEHQHCVEELRARQSDYQEVAAETCDSEGEDEGDDY